MKCGGFKHGVKPQGPLSKRRIWSACMNACEEYDQLRRSTILQGKRRRNRDDSIEKVFNMIYVFCISISEIYTYKT